VAATAKERRGMSGQHKEPNPLDPKPGLDPNRDQNSKISESSRRDAVIDTIELAILLLAAVVTEPTRRGRRHGGGAAAP
jgi:hypothetical protein